MRIVQGTQARPLTQVHSIVPRLSLHPRQLPHDYFTPRRHPSMPFWKELDTGQPHPSPGFLTKERLCVPEASLFSLGPTACQMTPLAPRVNTPTALTSCVTYPQSFETLAAIWTASSLCPLGEVAFGQLAPCCGSGQSLESGTSEFESALPLTSYDALRKVFNPSASVCTPVKWKQWYLFHRGIAIIA